jgi:cobalt-zinc-cadmium efflux system protein
LTPGPREVATAERVSDVTAPSAAGRHRTALAAGLLLSCAVFAGELIAGLAANSLALLADSWHVFADVAGLAIALGAVWVAGARPISARRSFGLYRAEILAAVVVALLLLTVSVLILWEAWQRLIDPVAVDVRLMALAALGALVANAMALRLLARGRRESLTVRGAYLEVLSDLLGSAAVLVAALVTAFTGLLAADAVASILIGLLIIPRTLRLLRDALDVLLEATPRGVDMQEVRRHILEAPGVQAVHDLHAWTITSGMNVLSAHVVLADDANAGAVLDHLGTCLSNDFDITHSTFQLENAEHVAWERNAAQVQH